MKKELADAILANVELLDCLPQSSNVGILYRLDDAIDCESNWSYGNDVLYTTNFTFSPSPELACLDENAGMLLIADAVVKWIFFESPHPKYGDEANIIADILLVVANVYNQYRPDQKDRVWLNKKIAVELWD